MKLPKVNQRKQMSYDNQTNLRIQINQLIREYQKENNYTFETYEIDNVLLDIVKSRHVNYIQTKFSED